MNSLFSGRQFIHSLLSQDVQGTHQCFLIDDDLDDQEIFSMALEEIDESIECNVAKSGIEGLQKLGEDIAYRPGFIFIDMNMPKMNGLQCLEAIRKLDHLQDSKIIMFSTSADAKLIEVCMQKGANDFLIKPPGFMLLVDSLSKLLGI